MVDKALIGKKLERIAKYLKTIRQKKDPGLRLFKKDEDLQSLILFNLVQAIQACSDIGAHIISDQEWESPDTQAGIFEILANKKVITASLSKKMKQMVGFRNIVVHEYEKVDLDIVYTVWKKHLSDIEKFCKAVILKYNL